MKQRHLVGVILFASLLCLPSLEFAKSKPKTTPRPRPVCVQCSFNGDCRSCTGGGTAVYCETFNCGACSEEGECSGHGHGGILQATQAVPDSKQPLRLSGKVIREIGAKHPRFAITLAEMNVYGVSPGKRRVYWTPIPLTTSDVAAFLSKEAHSRFFKQYDKDVRKLNRLIQKGELSDIVYAISIKDTEDGYWSIEMKVETELAAASVDPGYSTLEIDVRVTPAVQNSLGQPSRKKVTWRLH